MQSVQKPEVTLNLRADLVFLPVATSFVEKAAAAFGMDEPAALSLTLATEEVFAYLCDVVAAGKDVQLRCRGAGYYVDQEFLFESRGFNMRAFNLTCSATMDDQACMEETGLLIASRMVDRFQFLEEGKSLRLILTKEKSYPSVADLPVPDAKLMETFSIRPPDVEELKALVHLAHGYYSSPVIPESFSYPGKIVDMVACGEYQSAIAADNAGHIGGGIVWRWTGAGPVELYGPYVFNQPPDSGMGQALVDFCLGAIARIGAIGVISRRPTPEFPTEYFESLGSLLIGHKKTARLETISYYRHLEEDLGLSVWAHNSINMFLTGAYQRLAFAREIKPVTSEGESLSSFSVLSTEFDRGAGQVTLRPIWWGNDSEMILTTHVEMLLKEDLDNILFEMDLGKSWHCYFTPALFNCGFEPRLVLPYAGQGDLVIFQHRTGETSQ